MNRRKAERFCISLAEAQQARIRERIDPTYCDPRLSSLSADPFFLDPQPTNQDVREYLRHSNANYAYDATRKKDLGAMTARHHTQSMHHADESKSGPDMKFAPQWGHQGCQWPLAPAGTRRPQWARGGPGRRIVRREEGAGS